MSIFFIFGLGIIYIGIGVLNYKPFAYDWGVGTAGINILIECMSFLKDKEPFNFTIVFFGFILFSLFKNKDLFE